MIEMEQKYRIDDPRKIEELLRSEGAQYDRKEKHVDLFFSAPDRNFGETDEVLRLRCVDDQSVLTYKGPRQNSEIKARKEIEAELKSGNRDRQALIGILQALGYQSALSVEKTRDNWKWNFQQLDIHVCLDRLESVGDFLELEVVGDASELSRIKKTFEAAEKLLGLTVREERSYLRMVLELL
ncbi:class IV adenylate cyclase [Telmatocola sphagniphila]|uniref:Class IV adenylate cyclase n=1 Tax=Telmatocola sphagniphila TaxID=1123043 RepID=A0A8E6B7N7_9BACT|nr:class IV adenylate cyclase [Telmatocola sphagniphila]QVL32867.1 class IV adenylate cyclase [Telmatocola sphagniphila]